MITVILERSKTVSRRIFLTGNEIESNDKPVYNRSIGAGEDGFALLSYYKGDFYENTAAYLLCPLFHYVY